jgi:hypothetical protein
MIYEGIGMMHDPRTDLERLPSENLFDLARNDAATHRKLAIQLLVERGSHLACRDEIAAEARDYVLNDPIVLKRIDPASAALATAKLPNIIDCLAHEQTKRVELSRVVGEHHAAHTQKNATLEATVTENRVAGEQALAQAYELLWGYFARQGWQLAQAHTDQKLDFDRQLQTLQEEHEKDITAATARLTLLERSLWRKLVDYLKSVKRNWLARRPPANPPVSA